MYVRSYINRWETERDSVASSLLVGDRGSSALGLGLGLGLGGSQGGRPLTPSQHFMASAHSEIREIESRGRGRGRGRSIAERLDIGDHM